MVMDAAYTALSNQVKRGPEDAATRDAVGLFRARRTLFWPMNTISAGALVWPIL